MSENIVIVAALRTAVGSFGGSLAGIPAKELGAAVIRALLDNRWRSRLQRDGRLRDSQGRGRGC